MRTIEYRTAHVPAFLTKLWKLVTDPNSDDLISWNVNGTSFIIYDEIRFSRELLPMYFKHNNMASFVRQLNMYGFRKLSCIDQGGIHSAKHEIEFYHQYFIKDQESLLDLIKRKIPSSRTSEDPKVKPEYVKELISNIKNLQGKQRNAEEGMKSLRHENKILWEQLSVMNGRYAKQQAMLQQVVPLFMNMVHSSHRIAIKRRQPLMIDEGEIDEKTRRLEPRYYVEHEDSNMGSPLTPSPGNVSNRGPVIHDVTEMESSKMFADNILCSNTTTEHDVIVDSPLSSLGSSDYTADSPYTDGDSMEPLNILNCNFQSIPSLSPPSSDIVPPVHMASRPELLVRDINMSQVTNHIGNLSSLPSSLHTAAAAPHECAAIPIASTNLSTNGSFQTPVSGNNVQKPFQVDILDESANHSTLLPNDAIARQVQDINNVLNWMPNGSCENDQNIDNWLGQLIKADNLIAGASLPDTVGLGQNV